MKKQQTIAAILLVFLCFFLTGCFKGEFVLNINENGTSDLKYTVVGIPFIQNQISTMKEDARKNGMAINDIQDGNMRGFIAEKHFENPQEISNIKFFASNNEQNRGFVTQKGWLYDLYIVDLFLEGNQKGNDSADKTVQKTVLSNIDVTFTLNLPVQAEMSNAATASNDKKSLKWQLDIETDNHVQATAKVWHTSHIIITGIWIILLLAIMLRRDVLNRNSSQCPWGMATRVAIIGLVFTVGFVGYDFVQLDNANKISDTRKEMVVTQGTVETQKNVAVPQIAETEKKAAESKDMSGEQTALKVLYGKWVIPSSGQVKYEFDQNNLKMVANAKIDPQGAVTARVSLKKPDGTWTTNSIVCYVQLENGQYVMNLVRRNEKGNEIKGEDWGVKYIKVK
ncbi:hypothetical protein [Anaerospora hongkongensis]|uniref:hypothetical protein n=1 Tax=Anaerospora hongkongensis TaxID=244830 RepID=UPI0028A1B7EE|nr:hypothetical protein [Anaerospora hongkongensis]